jgi:hypothetical protein
MHQDPLPSPNQPQTIAKSSIRTSSPLLSSVSLTSSAALAGPRTADSNGETKRTQKRPAEDRRSCSTTAKVKRPRPSQAAIDPAGNISMSEKAKQLKSPGQTATPACTQPITTKYGKTLIKTPTRGPAKTKKADISSQQLTGTTTSSYEVTPPPLSDKAAGKRRAILPSLDTQGAGKTHETSKTPTASTKSANEVLPAVLQTHANILYLFAEALSGLGYTLSLSGAQSLSKDSVQALFAC